MENKIKWGVIGSGGIARRRTIPEGIMHADHAILTSVYDINSEANASVAREFNAKAVNSIQELNQFRSRRNLYRIAGEYALRTSNRMCEG